MSYFLNPSDPAGTAPSIVVPIIGDTIFLSTGGAPGSVRAASKAANVVVGSMAFGVVRGKITTAAVVGDWEVR